MLFIVAPESTILSFFHRQAAEKEWEVKRQNMGHYDGREFEKILQEAQANMMKGIPSLDIQENPTLPPAAAEEQPGNGNPAESLSGTNLSLKVTNNSNPSLSEVAV